MFSPCPSKPFDKFDKLSIKHSLKGIKKNMKKSEINWRMLERIKECLFCKKWTCFGVVKNELNCSVTLKAPLKINPIESVVNTTFHSLALDAFQNALMI